MASLSNAPVLIVGCKETALRAMEALKDCGRRVAGCTVEDRLGVGFVRAISERDGTEDAPRLMLFDALQYRYTSFSKHYGEAGLRCSSRQVVLHDCV